MMNRLQLFIYLIYIWNVLFCKSTTLAPNELQALEDIYYNTNGPQWQWSNKTGVGIPWNFTNPQPCNSTDSFYWQGLLCSIDISNTDSVYHIRSIILPNYNITGRLPQSIGLFPNLTVLELTSNSISGTIPSEIGNLLALNVLDLAYNQLSGTLPISLQNLQQLIGIRLKSNYLQGYIPNYIGLSYPLLITITLSDNLFSGTIPYTLNNLTTLQYLDLSDNHLYGSIPITIYNLNELRLLQLSNNYISGSIAYNIYTCSNLTLLLLDANHLTNSIPNTITQLSLLIFIDLESNYLTNTIPYNIGNLYNLQFLRINNNYLTGNLPISIGNLNKLEQLYSYNNYFTGSIPSSFSKLSSLLELLLHNNQLNGNLNNIFNSTIQTKLFSIQLQNNYFTGNIPIEPFQISGFLSFVIGKNCFIGQFPIEICNCHSLRNLVLDGLHSSKKCRKQILPKISLAYITPKKSYNTIQKCYFNLPNLLSLHLSGNEISGILPYNINISQSLIDLSLSHNLFRSKIPITIQNRAFLSLDLSYNYFDGELIHNFGQNIKNYKFGNITYNNKNVKLSLNNNRLSGFIPNIIKNIQNINILNGNIFQCYNNKELPQNDHDINKYNCGSSVFDIPYYVWLSLSTVVCILAFIIFNYKNWISQNFELISKYINIISKLINLSHTDKYNINLKTYHYISDISQIVIMLSIVCASICIFILSPLYIILHVFYNTHAHAYAWTVSSAFLEGQIPFSILFIIYIILICILLGFYARNLKYNHNDWRAILSERELEKLEIAEERQNLPKANLWQRIVIYTPMIFINFTVVISVNIIFVYIVLYHSTSIITIAQLLLSFFKLFWNKVGSRYISRYTAYISSKKPVKFARAEFFTLQLFIAMVNNIGIPCMVVMFTSPSCIYNMFIQAEPSNSYYTSLECIDTRQDGTCLSYSTELHSSSYDSPFTYSYQCSAGFITYYASAFVTLCLFSGFGTPIIQFCCAPLYPYTKKGTWLRSILKRIVPKLLRLPKPNLTEKDIKMDFFRPIFDSNQLLLSLLTNLAIMMTFGVVFPPLAASMAFTIISILFFSKLKVGIFINNAMNVNSSCLVHIIDNECKTVGFMPVLHRSIWQITTCSLIFYTWFLFDILGNTEGLSGSYWVFIVYPLLPAVILPIHILYRADAYARYRRGLDAAINTTSTSTTTSTTTTTNKLHSTATDTSTCGDVELASIGTNTTSEADNVLHDNVELTSIETDVTSEAYNILHSNIFRDTQSEMFA